MEDTVVALKGNKSTKKTILHLLERYALFLVLVGMISILSLLSPAFLQLDNIFNVLRQMSIIGIIAMGVTIIIITAGIDLSSGSVVAAVSVVVASFAHPGIPLIVSILLGIVVGTTAGLINGVLVTKGRIAPFIATLGMMTAARGFALKYTDGKPIGDLSPSFEAIATGRVAGIPIPIIIFGCIAFLSYLMLEYTRLGRHTYAIGGNEQAATICGVNVNRVKIFIYSYAGLLTGVAGILLTSRISAGLPTAGVGYELDAITAAVIGGTSLFGGIGTIIGTVIGVLIIGIINNGMDLLNVSSYWQQMLKGVIIIIAIMIDSRRNK